MLLVEQNANLAMQIAHRVYLLETVASSPPVTPTRSPTMTASARRTSGTDDWTASSDTSSRPVRGVDLLAPALGLVVIFRGTGHLNFAAGEMATCLRVHHLGRHDLTLFSNSGLPLWLATLVGMVLGFALGAATEVSIVSPSSKKSPAAVFVVLIAILLGINSLDVGRWGALPSEELRQLVPQRVRRLRPRFGAVWR